MVYYKETLTCIDCKEKMEARSSTKLRCSECKKIHIRKYQRDWLKNPDKLAQHKATQKVYQKNNLKARALKQKEYVKRNPDRIRAHSLSQGLEIGTCCEICGDEKSLHKHHWNYNKPLLISTLCVTCHIIQHLKNFRESKYAEVIQHAV